MSSINGVAWFGSIIGLLGSLLLALNSDFSGWGLCCISCFECRLVVLWRANEDLIAVHYANRFYLYQYLGYLSLDTLI